MPPVQQTLTLTRTPGGLASVDYGLNRVKLYNFYTNISWQKYKHNCNPISSTCQIYAVILICMTKVNESDIQNKLENKIIRDFQNLTKTFPLVNSFFKDLSVKVRNCNYQKNSVKVNFPNQRSFFGVPSATFTSRQYEFHQKLILAGALFRVSAKPSYEFIGDCSKFVVGLDSEVTVICRSVSLVTAEEFGDNQTKVLRQWSIWARVRCITHHDTVTKDCGPPCDDVPGRVACTQGMEICIRPYVKVNTSVSYLRSKNKTLILRRTEMRCTFLDLCNTAACQKGKCIPIYSNKTTCATMQVKVTDANNRIVSDIVPIGSKIRCNFTVDQNFYANHGIQPHMKWVLFNEEDQYRAVVKGAWIEFPAILNIKSIEIEPLKVSCQNVISPFIPVFEVLLSLSVFQKPTKVWISGQSSKFIYSGQTLVLISDGLPIYKLRYNCTIPTNNFQIWKEITEVSPIIIPTQPKLGLFRLMCYAEIHISSTEIFKSPKVKFQYTLVHLTDFSWGSEQEIVYVPYNLKCMARSYLTKFITINQLRGSSYLFKAYDYEYQLTKDIDGGIYSVLCTISIINEKDIFFSRKYTFNVYKTPSRICIIPIVSYSQVYIRCLHDGYPNDMVTTHIEYYKESLNNHLTGKENDSTDSSRIAIHATESSKITLKCNIKHNSFVRSLKLVFSILKLNNDGLTIKGRSLTEQNCSEKIYRANFQTTGDRFWIQHKVNSGSNFSEVKISIALITIANITALMIFLIHVYSFDAVVSVSLSVNSLSRRHCIMRLYNKMTELALFQIKSGNTLNVGPLRNKFEAYRVKDEKQDELNKNNKLSENAND